MRGICQLCWVAGISTNQSYRMWGERVRLRGCDLLNSLKPSNDGDRLCSYIYCSGHRYKFVTMKTEAATGSQLLAQLVRSEKGSCHRTRWKDGLHVTMVQG